MTKNDRPDPAATIRHAAEHVREQARIAVAGRGRFAVALAGGSTPRRLHAELAGMDDIDWSAVEVYFGDERCVSPDDPTSNYRMAAETLLDRVPIRREAVHRIRGEIGAEAAAELYSDEIALSLGPAPRFDLVLLGMGTDGHTASLFPDTPGIETETRIAVATTSPVEPRSRVSLSLATINDARNVAFLVTGAEKAATVRRVFGGDPAKGRLPAALVRPRRGSLDVFLDPEAAKELFS